jgi:hypothetical protein
MLIGLKLLGVGMINDVGGERGETVAIISVMVSVTSVPSLCLNDALRVMTIIVVLA